ncbi:MAG: hypothetical protein KF784_12010 [Fimbriimonadaceae bacterium]|nr:hypothetical protein [Fimbriimonadaceae bacterium]
MAIKGDADKKKMIVLGVLVVVIGCVGAFQFISGSSDTAPTAKKEKKDPAAAGPIKNDINAANNVAASGNAATGTANAAMPEGNPNGQTTDVTAAVASNFPEDSPLRTLYTYKLPTRDPFADTTNPAITVPTAQQTPPPADTKPPRSNGRPPYNELGPLDPSAFQLPGASGGNINIEQGAGLPNAGAFNYHVTGVIEGARPAAVFSDDQGNQRLLTEGEKIDGDSRVISVTKGKVVVSHKGKKITLTMGGQPDAK